MLIYHYQFRRNTRHNQRGRAVNNKKILVIEPDRFVGRMVHLLFFRQGWAVVCEENPAGVAPSFVARFDPHVVVADLAAFPNVLSTAMFIGQVRVQCSDPRIIITAASITLDDQACLEVIPGISFLFKSAAGSSNFGQELLDLAASLLSK